MAAHGIENSMCAIRLPTITAINNIVNWIVLWDFESKAVIKNENIYWPYLKYISGDMFYANRQVSVIFNKQDTWVI